MLDQLSNFIVPKITYSVIIGGSSQKRQEYELSNNPDIIIATPGRLIDLLMNSKNVYVNTIETLVLDEADKLLEMGFTDHVNQVVKLIKQASMVQNRQTILLSATLSKGIKDLASLALKDAVEVKVEK